MDPRQERGLAIATKAGITQNRLGWKVPSQSGNGFYQVVLKDEPFCSCADFETRQAPCKHIYAVEFYNKKETAPDGTITETKAVRITYSQNWTAYNQAQTQEKHLFEHLLFDLCKDLESPKQTTGRPKAALSDMVFSSALKVYSTVSGRRVTCDLEEAHGKGYLAHTPHYNSIFNYLENPSMTNILMDLIEKSARPLKNIETDFAIDSSGFSTSTYARWFDEKYGKEKSKRQWLKAHLMTGVKTNIVTSVEVTPSYVHDSLALPGLVERTSSGFRISEVSADKAYLSEDALSKVASAGAVPYIPFKSNTTGKGSSLWEKMYGLFVFQKEDFMRRYHKRSNVETTFSMIKAKFGASVRSRSMTAQINEILLKVLCHNICVLIQSMFELGIVCEF